MKERGSFITVEGGHGCGKSTISQMLCDRLTKDGFEVVHSIDQQGTVVGRELRKINLEHEDVQIAPLTEALIIAAARHQNVFEVIKPGLDSGKVVIGERFRE